MDTLTTDLCNLVLTYRPVLNILFVFYSVRIVGRIMYLYLAK